MWAVPRGADFSPQQVRSNMETPAFFETYGAHLAAILTLTLMVGVSTHALMTKRDSRAAALWVGLILLTPFLGALLYTAFGINRIHRKALRKRGEHKKGELAADERTNLPKFPDGTERYVDLQRLVGHLVGKKLHPGNSIEILRNGEAAYPEMLKAIESAEHTVSLATYIFNDDEAGNTFLHALKAAVDRGVEVRVLVDAVGARYSLPPIIRKLKNAGIPTARFMPTVLPIHLRYLNLRLHRKLLVIDGKLGFTGGMNIQSGHLVKRQGGQAVRDTHFRLRGPVVGDLQEAFCEDWNFTVGELLTGPTWFPDPEPAGDIPARGIMDGPDDTFENLPWTLMHAIHAAHRSIKIVTPYFLPDEMLRTSLSLAAMRGVEVDIVVPLHNNLAMVKWAGNAVFPSLLKKGCRVWFSLGAFDHSKLLVIDDFWTMIGSANWDARSLYLNFEFVVETYDSQFARELGRAVDEKIQKSRQLTLEELKNRSILKTMRDHAVWLFTPVL